MIKLTSELPKCLLESEDKLNDFDFVLYHQYLKDEYYKNHYLNKRKSNPDRKMILDNSAYEFFVSGEKFNEEDFIRVINELKPDFYIVPDVLMDNNKTLENFYHWIPIVKHLDSKPYFVPQGRTYGEFESCMTEMDCQIRKNDLPKYFCIPFHNDFLWNGSIWDSRLENYYFDGHPTKDDKYALGRMTLMTKICNNSRYFGYKYHMLGSHNPIEINYYKLFNCIESLDTGYPVKLAVSGMKLGEEKGKPNIIIDDFYNSELDDTMKHLIIYNIRAMHNYRKNNF